jgi:hypothetical protein
MAGRCLHHSECCMQKDRGLKRNSQKSLDVGVADSERSRMLTIIKTAIKEHKWLVIGTVILCLIGTSFYLFEFTVVPEWKLRIVDQTGQRLRGNRVRESWCHYTFETQSHKEELLSDGDGYVQFPRRTIRGNLITWVAKFLKRFVLVHSSSGPSASVSYFGDYRLISNEPCYEPGRPLAAEIVVWRPE